MKHKEKLKNIFVSFLIIISGCILILRRADAVKGVSEGLSLCSGVLIPSLFPFMVLSSFCTNAGLKIKSASLLCGRILKIPCEGLSALVFGFVGGYPVGASVVASLYEKNVIDSATVRRLMSCCVNAGPAFVITAVGSVMFGNVSAGIMLFCSVCLASVLTGIAVTFICGGKYSEGEKKTGSVMPISDSLINAVGSSCSGMVVMCGWVTLFSAFLSMIKPFFSDKTAAFIMIFAEVTSGVEAARKTGGLPLVSACISFGGICVMCQLLPVIKKCGIKVYEYLLFRIVNSVFSFFITKLLLCFFDIPVSVGSFTAGVRSDSVLSVFSLLVMCAVFIYDVSSHKTDKMTLEDITG